MPNIDCYIFDKKPYQHFAATATYYDNFSIEKNKSFNYSNKLKIIKTPAYTHIPQDKITPATRNQRVASSKAERSKNRVCWKPQRARSVKFANTESRFQGCATDCV